MKIAQVVCTFPPYMAGTGNVCFHNSLELAKLGHDVTVFTSRYPDKDFKYPDLLRVVRYKPCFRIGNAPFLPRLTAIEKFDIVHLHYPFVFGAELVLLNSILRNNTLVITYHQDLIFGGILGYLVRIYNIIVRDQVISRAERILTPSLDHLASSAVKRILTVRKEDVVELPNGVDPEHFNPSVSNHELREKLMIAEEESVVLFVGALDKAHIVKGVDILLNALSKLKSERKVRLLIVGDGDLRPQYERLAKDLAISDRVIFTGTIMNSELPAYYTLSDLVVLPSTSVEMFGMVLVEAMACGKPVIGTTLPGLRTVVDDGKNGLLAEPGNVKDLTAKMQYLLDNEPVRKRFGAQGRKKAEDRYSWPKIGKTLEQVYVEVLSES